MRKKAHQIFSIRRAENKKLFSDLPSSFGDNHLVGQLFELDPQVGVVQRQFNIPFGHVSLLAALLELALHGAEEMLQALVGVGRRRRHISGWCEVTRHGSVREEVKCGTGEGAR